MATFRFNLENRTPTFNPPSVRTGALSRLTVTNSGLSMTIKRGSSFFDIVGNTGGQAKALAFGNRSLDPFFALTNPTQFTINFSRGVKQFSVVMGDYGDDFDTLRLRAFSSTDGKGTLLASTTKRLPANGLTFTYKVLRVSSETPIRSIRMIGGSTSFPNSVFYDNFVVTT